MSSVFVLIILLIYQDVGKASNVSFDALSTALHFLGYIESIFSIYCFLACVLFISEWWILWKVSMLLLLELFDIHFLCVFFFFFMEL